jgi:TonB family protein
MYKHFRYGAILVLLLAFGGTMSADMRVAGTEALKAAVKKSVPDYPPMAKQMKIMGKVEVEVTISPEGGVENVKVISGNSMLTTAVVNAVKQWKFTPFTQNGEPTKAVAALDFDFKF